MIALELCLQRTAWPRSGHFEEGVPCIRTPDKVNAACGKEGALGQQGFLAGKGTTGVPAKGAQRILWGGREGAAAFVNSSG